MSERENIYFFYYKVIQEETETIFLYIYKYTNVTTKTNCKKATQQKKKKNWKEKFLLFSAIILVIFLCNKFVGNASVGT